MSYGRPPAASGPIPSSSIPPGATEIDRLRATVSSYFPVYETRVTPASVVFLVSADPKTLEVQFDRMRQELWPQFFVPFIRLEGGEYIVEVYARPRRSAWGILPNLLLLLATITTTIFAGALLYVGYTGGTGLTANDFLYGGLEFALPLLGILGIHELAHYALCVHHHVEASLPFFLPVPPPLLFGTFGAFISIRQPVPDRKSLLDIGAAGPIAGFVMALPVTIVGLYLSLHSPTIPLSNCGVSILGLNYSSIAYGLSLIWLAFGQFFPLASISLNPVALAGWVGLFVTAINLLPAGSLDGGHVFRALFGDRQRYVSYAVIGVLFVLTFVTQYFGWLFFALLIFLLGLRHPPPLNDISRLDAKRWAVGAVAVAVLVSAFVLVPISEPTGSYTFSTSTPSAAPLPPGYSLSANVTTTIVNQDFVAHGFEFAAIVTGAIIAVNNTTETLTGAALAAYAANSTWYVHLPGGAIMTSYRNATFSLPPGLYLNVSAGEQFPLTVNYLNTQQATVYLQFELGLLCSQNFPGSAATTTPPAVQVS